MTISKTYCQNILRNNKLILICDIDETLLSSVFLKYPLNTKNMRSLHYFKLWNDPVYQGWCTKVRPNLPRFLSKISEKFELHAMSTGNKEYIDGIMTLIDPTNSIFGNRITTTENIVNGNFKLETVRNQFGKFDKIVCAIDDHLEDWDFNDRVVEVEPYQVFQNVKKGSNSSRKEMVQHIMENLIDKDMYLDELEPILGLIHSVYFASINQKVLGKNYENITENNLPDMETVLETMRSNGYL